MSKIPELASFWTKFLKEICFKFNLEIKITINLDNFSVKEINV